MMPGRSMLAITDAAGQPVEVGSIEVLIGRPTSARDDVTPEFAYVGGVYRAPVDLGPGLWMLRLYARDGLFSSSDSICGWRAER